MSWWEVVNGVLTITLPPAEWSTGLRDAPVLPALGTTRLAASSVVTHGSLRMSGSDPYALASRRPFVTAGAVALLLFVLYLAAQFVQVLFTVFAGVLLAVFLAGVSQRLRTYAALPRPVVLLLVVAGLGGLLAGLWALIGPGLSEQASELAALLPNAAERLVARLRQRAEAYAWARQLVDPSQLLPNASSVLGGVTNVFQVTLDVLVNVFIVVFIGIYGAVDPNRYVDNAVRLVPADRRDRAREIIHAIGRALRWWVAGRLTMMLIVGILTAVGLGVAGIPSPLALGLVAALCSFVPYLGPILSVVPALLVASTLTVTKVVYVLIVFGTVQMLESYLIAPLVQQRAVHIPPAVVITAQFIGGVGAGATGVLLATPLAIVVIVLVQTLYVEDTLGDPVSLLGEH
jgi:predicted PurR-regulated permease PerM